MPALVAPRSHQLAAADGTLFQGMTVDNLHLTVKGYQVWADGLRPMLTKLLIKVIFKSPIPRKYP